MKKKENRKTGKGAVSTAVINADPIASREERTLKTITRDLLAILNRNWALKTIATIIPSITAFVICFTPIQSLFVVTTESGSHLNPAGIIVNAICIILLIITTTANMISSHDNQDLLGYLGENQIRKKIAITESAYEEDKNRILRSGYRQIAYDNNNLKDFIRHYVNPKERTNQILTQISNCLAEECGVDSNEIVMSAIVSAEDVK